MLSLCMVYIGIFSTADTNHNNIILDTVVVHPKTFEYDIPRTKVIFQEKFQISDNYYH